ncbi:MAG: hypothetical protein WAT23_15040 [Chromatiaceae bacterium]
MNFDKHTDDRLRRIETKLTRLCIALNIDTSPVERPIERPADGHYNVPTTPKPPTYGSAAATLLRAFKNR